MNALPKLVAHCEWANNAWRDFIEARAASDDWLRQRISHIMLGERAWFQRIHGKEPGREIWRQLSFSELGQLAEEHHRVYADLLTQDLTRMIAFQRFTGEMYESPIADILLHLTLHGAHHRGQMATHASAVGLTPINTDFVQYCRIHRV
jgi:uncharacterized damage-inducible protein DinB